MKKKRTGNETDSSTVEPSHNWSNNIAPSKEDAPLQKWGSVKTELTKPSPSHVWGLKTTAESPSTNTQKVAPAHNWGSKAAREMPAHDWAPKIVPSHTWAPPKAEVTRDDTKNESPSIFEENEPEAPAHTCGKREPFQEEAHARGWDHSWGELTSNAKKKHSSVKTKIAPSSEAPAHVWGQTDRSKKENRKGKPAETKVISVITHITPNSEAPAHDWDKTEGLKKDNGKEVSVQQKLSSSYVWGQTDKENGKEEPADKELMIVETQITPNTEAPAHVWGQTQAGKKENGKEIKCSSVKIEIAPSSEAPAYVWGQADSNKKDNGKEEAAQTKLVSVKTQTAPNSEPPAHDWGQTEGLKKENGKEELLHVHVWDHTEANEKENGKEEPPHVWGKKMKVDSVTSPGLVARRRESLFNVGTGHRSRSGRKSPAPRKRHPRQQRAMETNNSSEFSARLSFEVAVKETRAQNAAIMDAAAEAMAAAGAVVVQEQAEAEDSFTKSRLSLEKTQKRVIGGDDLSTAASTTSLIPTMPPEVADSTSNGPGLVAQRRQTLFNLGAGPSSTRKTRQIGPKGRRRSSIGSSSGSNGSSRNIRRRASELIISRQKEITKKFGGNKGDNIQRQSVGGDTLASLAKSESKSRLLRSKRSKGSGDFIPEQGGTMEGWVPTGSMGSGSTSSPQGLRSNTSRTNSFAVFEADKGESINLAGINLETNDPGKSTSSGKADSTNDSSRKRMSRNRMAEAGIVSNQDLNHPTLDGSESLLIPEQTEEIRPSKLLGSDERGFVTARKKDWNKRVASTMNSTFSGWHSKASELFKPISDTTKALQTKLFDKERGAKNATLTLTTGSVVKSREQLFPSSKKSLLGIPLLKSRSQWFKSKNSSRASYYVASKSKNKAMPVSEQRAALLVQKFMKESTILLHWYRKESTYWTEEKSAIQRRRKEELHDLHEWIEMEKRQFQWQLYSAEDECRKEALIRIEEARQQVQSEKEEHDQLKHAVHQLTQENHRLARRNPVQSFKEQQIRDRTAGLEQENAQWKAVAEDLEAAKREHNKRLDLMRRKLELERYQKHALEVCIDKIKAMPLGHLVENEVVDRDPLKTTKVTLPNLVEEPTGSADDFTSGRQEEFSDVYELGKKLGEGAFGVVYVCTHKVSGSERAVKIIEKDSMAKWELDDVLKEFQMLTSFDNPNVIQVYEFYDTEENFFMVQELAQGGELFDELHKHEKLKELDVAVLMKNILSCADYLAQRRIVHRDLNLENILLKEPGDYNSVRLIDFGLAATVEEGQKLFELVGKPRYLAPEVLGDHGYGVAYDVWSSGIVAATLLTGFFPIDGATDGDVYNQIMEGARINFEDEDWKGISDQGKSFVQALLTVDEYARPTAAEALQHPWITGSNEKTLSTAQVWIAPKQELVSVFEAHPQSDTAARVIQKFLRDSTEILTWHRRQMSYWLDEQKDIERRRQEELDDTNMFLELEKQLIQREFICELDESAGKNTNNEISVIQREEVEDLKEEYLKVQDESSKMRVAVRELTLSNIMFERNDRTAELKELYQKVSILVEEQKQWRMMVTILNETAIELQRHLSVSPPTVGDQKSNANGKVLRNGKAASERHADLEGAARKERDKGNDTTKNQQEMYSWRKHKMKRMKSAPDLTSRRDANGAHDGGAGELQRVGNADLSLTGQEEGGSKKIADTEAFSWGNHQILKRTDSAPSLSIDLGVKDKNLDGNKGRSKANNGSYSGGIHSSGGQNKRKEKNPEKEKKKASGASYSWGAHHDSDAGCGEAVPFTWSKNRNGTESTPLLSIIADSDVSKHGGEEGRNKDKLKIGDSLGLEASKHGNKCMGARRSSKRNSSGNRNSEKKGIVKGNFSWEEHSSLSEALINGRTAIPPQIQKPIEKDGGKHDQAKSQRKLKSDGYLWEDHANTAVHSLKDRTEWKITGTDNSESASNGTNERISRSNNRPNTDNSEKPDGRGKTKVSKKKHVT